MRREAEERARPKRKLKLEPNPRAVDPKKLPVLDRDNWLGYLRTGEIEAS